VIAWLVEVCAPARVRCLYLSYGLGREMGLTRWQSLRVAWRAARG
jgi:hypothetical protein